MLANKLMSTLSGGAGDKLYVDDVFSTYLYTGNGSTQTINNGIDLAGKGGLVWTKSRAIGYNHCLYDTLRGVNNSLTSNDTSAQVTATPYKLTSFNSNGFSLGINENSNQGGTSVSWTFRKAPKFFDIVTYTGNGVAGRQIPHELGVAPGMIVVKCLNIPGLDWEVYHRSLGSSKYIQLNLINASTSGTSRWGGVDPSSSVFSVGADTRVNGTGGTYVAYLFASLPGISKVGSYTGNGTSQTIPCGFTTGARFILIKRTDATGDWYIWDTARGIISANDPHLSLNTAAAEVTTDDSVDPEASGFIVNQNTATNINVSGGQYIFLSIA